MLSSVLEASVSGPVQCPESPVSVCQAQLFSEVPYSLLAELKSEGNQHADLEQSCLKCVSANLWSTDQANNQVREKCRLYCHKHGEPPVYLQPAEKSPASEETQNSMDEQLVDAMEVQDSIGRGAIENFSQKTANLLHESIKIEAPEETEKAVMKLDVRPGVTVGNITQHVLTIDNAILDAFKKVTMISLNNEAPRTLECGTHELEACSTLHKVVQEPLKETAKEMLAQVSLKPNSVLEQGAVECDARDTMEFESQDVMQKETCHVLEKVDLEVGRKDQDLLVHETNQMLEQNTSYVLGKTTHESLKQACRELLERVPQIAPNVLELEAYEEPAVQVVMEFKSNEGKTEAVCEVQKLQTCAVQKQAASTFLQLDYRALEQEANSALERDFEALELAAKSALERDCDVLERAAKAALEQDRVALEQAAKAALDRALKALELAAKASLKQDLAALEQTAKDALQRDRAALEQATKQALALSREAQERESLEAQERQSHEAQEQVAKEAREALEREACMVLEQVEKEALELEACKGLEGEAHEELEQEFCEMLQQASKTSKEARLALEREAREALGQVAETVLERQGLEVVDQATMEVCDAHELLEQSVKVGLEQEARKVLEQAAMKAGVEWKWRPLKTFKELKARENVERAVAEKTCRAATELETCDTLGTKTLSEDGEVPIHRQLSFTEDHHDKEKLPVYMPVEGECHLGSKRIACMLDMKGETQAVVSKSVTVLCENAQAHIEPCNEVQRDTMTEFLAADSSECLNDSLSMTNHELSEICTVMHIKPLTPVINGQLHDTNHIAIECTSATVCRDLPVSGVYSAINQDNNESYSTVAETVSSIVLEQCTTDPEKVTYKKGIFLSSCVTVGSPAKEISLGSCLALETAVPSFNEKRVEGYLANTNSELSDDMPHSTSGAVQETVLEEQQLHEKIEAWHLRSDTDSLEEIRSTGDDCSMMCVDSLVQPEIQELPPASSTLQASAFVLQSKDSSTMQNQTISCRNTLAVGSSEGFADNANQEKTEQMLVGAVCSKVEGKVDREWLANDFCFTSAAYNSLHSTQEQGASDKLPLNSCSYSVKDPEKVSPQTVQDCAILAAVGIGGSDVEKQLICSSKISVSTMQKSLSGLLSSGSSCNPEFILPLNTGTNEYEGLAASHPCHKQNVCCSSTPPNPLKYESGCVQNESNHFQILSKKPKVEASPVMENTAESTVHCNVPDMNKHVSLKDQVHSSHSDSLAQNQLASQASVGKLSELEWKPVSEGLQNERLKAARDPICNDYKGYITVASENNISSCETLALQSTLEVAAFTAFCPVETSSRVLDESTIMCSEDEGRSVTHLNQCAETALACSKEDALNQSLCSTLLQLSSIANVETSSAIEAKESFSSCSSYEHEKHPLYKRHPNISQANHANRHPENTVLETVLLEHCDLGTDSEISSHINPSVRPQSMPSSTMSSVVTLIGGITAELNTPLESCLETVDSSVVGCSRLVASNKSLELEIEPSNNSIEKPPVGLTGDRGILSAIENDLPELLEKITVSKKHLRQDYVQDCTTSTVENTKQRCLNMHHLLNIVELKPSQLHLLEKSNVCEPSAISNNVSDCSALKKKEMVFDSLQKVDCERKLKKVKKQSKSDRVGFFPDCRRKTVMLLKSPSKNFPFAAAVALQADGRFGSTPIKEFKMSCKQFSTELNSPLKYPKYDLSRGMLHLAHPTMAAAVESTLHPSTYTNFQSKSVLANISDAKEHSFTPLKVCYQQDVYHIASDTAVQKCRPSFSEQHSECSLNMELIKECSVGDAEMVCTKTMKVNSMQRQLPFSEAKCHLAQDSSLNSTTDLDNVAITEMTIYNPCMAESQSQKICNTQAECQSEVDCNPALVDMTAPACPEIAKCQKWQGRANFKRTRMGRGASKLVPGVQSISAKESVIKPASCTGLKRDNLMQIPCCNGASTSTSTNTVMLSRQSQKISSLCVPETVCVTEVKQPVVCHPASMSTLQVTKRPKILLQQFSTPSSCSDATSLSGNAKKCPLSHTTIPFKSFSPVSEPQAVPMSGNLVKCDVLHTVEGGSKLGKQFMLKKQPERRCKIILPAESLCAMKKTKPRNSLSCLRTSQNSLSQQPHTIPHATNTITPKLVSKAGTERLMDLVVKQRKSFCRYQNCMKLRKSTKEVSLLDRLSIIANNLLLPSQSSHTIMPSVPPSKSVMLPDRFCRLRSNRLLEIFSCVKMRINSHFSSSWSSVLSKDNPMPFCNQPVSLYPSGSSLVHCMNLSSSGTNMPFGTPVFPISFHIKLDSRQLLDFVSPPSHHYDPVRWEPDSLSSQPSEWTLSFFLSQSSSATDASSVFREDVSLAGELKPRALCLWSKEGTDTTHERGRRSLNRRQPGCSMHGLHTVLALSSPGCYRFWTRRRNLGSRIPTVQRLFMAQFAQGLKGMRAQTPIADEAFSALPYSLGQVLSTWSQHGVSLSSPLATDVHLNSWQPSVDLQFSITIYILQLKRGAILP